jgi:hypothetical protein
LLVGVETRGEMILEIAEDFGGVHEVILSKCGQSVSE